MTVRRLLFVPAAVALAGLVALEATAVPSWWSQPVEAFFGRRERWDASDFAAFYSAGKLVASGQGHRLFHPGDLTAMQHSWVTLPEGHVLPYLNPPFFAAIVAPLTWLPFGHAYQAWTLFNAAMLALCCWLLWRTAAPLDRRWRIAIVAGFLTLQPVTYAVRQGQFSLILVASLAGAHLLLRQGRDRAAGVALALLLIKPELLVPIAALLAWKRRRAVFATLLPLTFVAVAASIAIVGPAEAARYPSYVWEIAGRDGIGTFTPGMFGWNGLLGSTFGQRHAGAEALAHVPLSLIALAATAALWRGPWRRDDGAFAACWLALVLATVLADAHLYLQDTILVAPAAVAFAAAQEGGRRHAAGLALAAGWAILGLGSVPNLQWHINLFALYMAALLLAIAVWHVWQERTLRRVGASDAPAPAGPSLQRAA